MNRFSTLKTWQKIVGAAAAVGLAAFLIIQFVPLSMDNPPVVSEPAWDTPQTRELAQAACFDCHSNETVWPWYSKIAPVRLLIWRDVEEGRGKLNFSDWARHPGEVEEIEEVVKAGEMPPWYYTLMHSDAKLSEAEKRRLVDGLAKTIAASSAGEQDEHEEENEG